MFIDEALKVVLGELNNIMIPASEAEKMTKVKTNIQEVITAVRRGRETEQKKQEEGHHED